MNAIQFVDIIVFIEQILHCRGSEQRNLPVYSCARIKTSDKLMLFSVSSNHTHRKTANAGKRASELVSSVLQ